MLVEQPLIHSGSTTGDPEACCNEAWMQKVYDSVLWTKMTKVKLKKASKGNLKEAHENQHELLSLRYNQAASQDKCSGFLPFEEVGTGTEQGHFHNWLFALYTQRGRSRGIGLSSDSKRNNQL